MNLLVVVLLMLAVQSCKKEGTKGTDNVVYTETISSLERNEPLLITFANAGSTAKVVWTVSPSANVTLSAVGNKATFTFSEAGNYLVTAVSGGVEAKYTVVVSSTIYEPYGTAFLLYVPRLVNINQGEEMIFSAHNVAAGNAVSWSSSNLNNPSQIDAVNKTFSVTFSEAGSYSVTATDGTHTQRRTVWVNDPANSNPNLDTVPFILGEKLLLTPSVEAAGGVQQLVIRAATTNTYHCSTDKVLSFSNNTVYMIDYSGVVIADQPCSAPAPASVSNSFSGIVPGTYPFTINFGNQTFTGSFTLTNSGIYTFTWPDSNVVSIAPLTVR